MEVRAPFDGVITSQEISAFDRVSVGQDLFTLVSQDITPKVIAEVTSDELSRLRAQENIQIRFSTGEIVPVDQSHLSSKINLSTQKIRVEFPLTSLPDDVLVGSFARLLIPPQNGSTQILPLSSLSFEPGGAEVLVLDDDSVARRAQIQYGKIVSDGVEVLSGLEPGTLIVRYRKQAHAGEIIIPIE